MLFYMFYILFELLFVHVLYRQCAGGQWQLVSDLSEMVVCCQTIVNMQITLYLSKKHASEQCGCSTH